VAASPTLRRARRYSRLSILDRYMLTELSGPFVFGLSAFTLIFAATQLLAIGRMVSSEHIPLWAAIEIFLWGLPGYMGLVIPMALLLGTLLAIQRLSGESELTAMKAGGISFTRRARHVTRDVCDYGVCRAVRGGPGGGDRRSSAQSHQRVQSRSYRLRAASGRRQANYRGDVL
jgi:hypothetical protein